MCGQSLLQHMYVTSLAFLHWTNSYNSLNQAIPQILLLLQCIIILLHEMGQVQIAAMLCPASTSPSFNALSTMDVILAGVIVFMGLIRVWCFSTLGQFFTYEITIRPNHKLVTSGPYSFVRHPGYTCSISVIIGMIFFMVFSPNTSLQACGITEMVSLAKWVAWAWAAMVVYICWILVGRTSIEDENLRRTFGKEWEQYRNRVTKRFIPGLI